MMRWDFERDSTVRNWVQKLRSTGIGGSSVLLFMATMFVNISTYAFHLVVSRQVSSAEYGAVAALLGLMLIATVPATALQLAITNKFADRRNNKTDLELLDESPALPVTIRPLVAQVAIGSVLVAAIVALISPLLKDFIHLDSITPCLMLALFIIAAGLTTIPKAVLLGELRFRKVALAFMIGALTRVISGYVLSKHFGVTGAVGSSVVAEAITGLVLVYDMIEFMPRIKDAIPLRLSFGDAGIGTLALAGFWALVSYDVLIARHFLTPHSSGIYGAAATIARSTMFLPSAVALVAFPLFVRAGPTTEKGRRLLLNMLAIVAGLALAAAAVLIVFPQFVELLGHGNTYQASESAVKVLGISCAFLGVIYLLVHYEMAAQPIRAAIYPWIGTFGGTIAIAIFHNSTRQVSFVATITTGTTMLLMLRDCFAIKTSDNDQDRDLIILEELGNEESTLMLSIVVPFLNPGEALSSHVQSIVDVLESRGISFEIIAVDDGSTDGSKQSLEDMGHDSLRLVSLSENRGKGEALRTGLSRGKGRYLGFIDADGDISAQTLATYLDIIYADDPDIVLGSKRHPNSEVSLPPMRRLYSWGYQQIIRFLFRLNIRDTQTGIKIVRRDVLKTVLPRMVEKRFAFDLELFVAAKRAGYSSFYEAPVTIRHQLSSTISFRDVWNTWVDTMAIFYRAHVLLRYEQRPAIAGEAQVARERIAAQQT
jgi:O-antigen/teichoic acid export membrane protein